MDTNPIVQSVAGLEQRAKHSQAVIDLSMPRIESSKYGTKVIGALNWSVNGCERCVLGA
jgi:hypothetical protein